MPQPAEIETYLLKTEKLFLFAFGLFLFVLTGLGFTILLSNGSKEGFSLITIVIGVILFFIFPFVFVNKKITLFTKKAMIKLTDDFLKIDILNRKTYNLEEQHEYHYCNIKSFQMAESAYNNSSYIKLILSDGAKVKYSFFEQTDNEENVLKNIRIFFASYNEGKSINEKITIQPSFYATKAGRYSIVGLSVLMGITILLQVIYKPQTIPFSLLFGILLYSRIKTQQKGDIELYEKFK